MIQPEDQASHSVGVKFNETDLTSLGHAKMLEASTMGSGEWKFYLSALLM